MSLACDMIIKNGLVFDGSGELPIIKDIAVANGKIVAQGEDLDVGKATGQRLWLCLIVL